MKWSYGVMTVTSRLGTLLPRTLSSLALGGFPEPSLSIDGPSAGAPPSATSCTTRNPPIRTAGNWFLSMWELYIRVPDAERYILFQDDMVTYKNLRQYLEAVLYPTDGYCNLYTFPHNDQPKKGWYQSNQRGLGAVALMFDNKTLMAFLANQYMVRRFKDPVRGWQAVDGGIISAATELKLLEYVHGPSLVQHTGLQSSMGNKEHPLAPNFRGEDFDAMELLNEQAS